MCIAYSELINKAFSIYQSFLLQNLVIDKSCLVNLNISETICSDLDSNKADQEDVQKVVTLVSMYCSIATAIPEVLICLFVGPWSDQHGRKPVLIITGLGLLCQKLILLAMTYFRATRAEWYIATSVKALFFGGTASSMAAIYSYIADISTLRNRTARIAICDVCVMVGFPAGMFLSGKLYQYCGYYGVFGTAAVLDVINVLYVALRVKETRGPGSYQQLGSDEEPQAEQGQTKLINFENIKSVFMTCLKKRDHHLRRVILLLISVKMILNITNSE